MCRLKSGIILKDYVFIPDYDSHTNMLEELKIKDNITNASTLFVRAELRPTNNNIFSDISTWSFNVDQDVLPEWFIYEYDKQRMIEAVKKWSKNHVFENVDDLELKGNHIYYLKNCKNVKVYDNCQIIVQSNCTVNAYDNSTINAYNGSTVKAFNNSTVYAFNNCTVYAQNKCTINAFNNCIVNAYDNCYVESYDNCIIKVHDKCTVEAFENSTVKAYDNCTVYVYNDDDDDDNDYTVKVETYDNCKIINAGKLRS